MKIGITRSVLLTSTVLSLGLLGGCATTAEQPAAPAATQNMAEQNAAQAIAAAKATYAEAEAKGYAWTTTAPLIAKAEAAYKSGDYTKASALADKAKLQAEGGINQYYLAMGTRNLEKLRGMQSEMTPAQQAQLKQAEGLFHDSKGKALYDLTEQMLKEMESAKRTSVMVSKGDTLWGIASMPMVYGNPYEWPLIYKANSGKIHDPDLIYPGQNLTIDQHASQAVIDSAIYHAKHRGAWKLGQPTSSDLKYLKGGM